MFKVHIPHRESGYIAKVAAGRFLRIHPPELHTDSSWIALREAARAISVQPQASTIRGANAIIALRVGGAELLLGHGPLQIAFLGFCC